MSDMTPVQAEEAMFWLRSGMGLQEDKRFLLTMISDLKKQIAEHEQWQVHANKMYDAKVYELESLKTRMRALVDTACDPTKPVMTAEQEAVGAVIDQEGASHDIVPLDWTGPVIPVTPVMPGLQPGYR